MRVRARTVGFLVVAVAALAAGTVVASGGATPVTYETTWRLHPYVGGGCAMGPGAPWCGPEISVKICERAELEATTPGVNGDRVNECTTIYHRLTADEVDRIAATR